MKDAQVLIFGTAARLQQNSFPTFAELTKENLQF
jgi:hypothetical protein